MTITLSQLLHGEPTSHDPLGISEGGTGSTTAAAARAALGAHEALVSGQNLRTVNGQSLLGSTDLVTVISVNGLAGVVSGLQEELVSGANIKTVAGESLLGSGDIPIPNPNGRIYFFAGA